MSKSHSLEILVNLGFDTAEATAALQKVNGQLDKALDILCLNSQQQKEEYSLS